MLNPIEAIEDVSEWPHMFFTKPLIGNPTSRTNWSTRVVMGVEREADGMTIKRDPAGRVLAHIPGHDMTLFTGKPVGAHETQSGLPETIVPYFPEELIPLESSQPIDLGVLHARYAQG